MWEEGVRIWVRMEGHQAGNHLYDSAGSRLYGVKSCALSHRLLFLHRLAISAISAWPGTNLARSRSIVRIWTWPKAGGLNFAGIMAYLPLFPLKLVAFPGERLNLHIFEPRYRQLITECTDKGRTFGIPTFLDGTLPGYGTEMEVLEVTNQHANGNMDIKTRGLRVFQLTSFDNPAPGKLYAGGQVARWPEPEERPYVMPELLVLVERLYRVFETELRSNPKLPQPYSYQIGHGVGLPTEAEYELLTLESETERQEFLYEHLQEVMPIIENMERAKERIRMNGHFREFGELNF